MQINKQGIFINRNSKNLNYGQTGTILSFNEFSDLIIFKPDGSFKKYELHFSEVIPIAYLYTYPLYHCYKA